MPVRLDKWLWAARFYRTRSLAAQAIEAGHVRVDGERVKPAQAIRAGTRASVRKQHLLWEFDVTQTSLRRGSAADAALLYRETPESAAAREVAARAQLGIEPDERSRGDELLGEPVVFGVAAVAPVDVARLGERRHPRDPVDQLGVTHIRGCADSDVRRVEMVRRQSGHGRIRAIAIPAAVAGGAATIGLRHGAREARVGRVDRMSPLRSRALVLGAPV